MEDIRTENITTADKEPGPTTRFGTALVGFADRMDALAGKETNRTHKQLWLALGIEAVAGALIIAAIGSGNEVNSREIILNLLKRMKYTGTVTGKAESGTVDWGIEMTEGVMRGGWSGYGKSLLAGYEMKIGDFARALIEGGFKDETGKSVLLLNNESTSAIVEQLDQLTDLEGKRDKLRNLFLLGGVCAVGAALQAKAGEKVKVSAPVGKVPAVMPIIANVMRGIGKLY